MSTETLATRLAEWASALNSLEAQAMDQLHGKNNEAAYRDLMKQRAELLRSLPEKAAALPPALRNTPEYPGMLEALEGFAQGAANALSIGSVFYMSALLYPDDHQPGDPNNLERLILTLQAR